MRVYFARPENVANTPLDDRLIKIIGQHPYFKGDDLIAPTLSLDPYDFHRTRYSETLIELARECSVFMFVAFRDGMIHFRHWEKMRSIHRMRSVIFEMTLAGEFISIPLEKDLGDRVLDRTATRMRLWCPAGKYKLPF